MFTPPPDFSLTDLRFQELDWPSMKVNEFDCSKDPINKFLKNRAKKQHNRGQTRVFVALLKENPRVVSYYALRLGSERTSELNSSIQSYARNDVAFPAVHLSFVGVHRPFQGKGVGRVMLGNALEKVYQISRYAGFYAVTLQSLDENSTKFYKSLGFEPYSDHPEHPKMLLPLQDVVDLFEGK